MTGEDPMGAKIDVREVQRIREVYGRRDRRALLRPLGGPRREAYRRINAERLERTDRLLGRAFPERPRLLDVGCGGGHDLRHWLDEGWPPERLAGVDVVADRLDIARTACPGIDLRLGDGVTLPFDDGSCDVVTATTVFSSILDSSLRRRLFQEMRRVTASGGLILIYDFVLRNPRNPDVVPMPLRRLHELGTPPTGSARLSPFLYAIAAGAVVGDRLATLAMRVAPPTHRLSWWRIDRARTDAREPAEATF